MVMGDHPTQPPRVTTLRSLRAGALRSVTAQAGWEALGMVMVLLVLVGFFSLRSQHFWGPATFRNVVNQVPDLVAVSVGMTLVLVVGGIDLSVGSVMALSGAVLGVVLVPGAQPLAIAIAAALGVGALCGAMNGYLTAYGSIPAFIVTLGMLEIARGAAYRVTDTKSIYLGRQLEWIALPLPWSGIAPAMWIALGLVVVVHLGLTRTVWGRHAIAIGANEQAARYAGLSPRGMRWIIYTLSGACAGLAAVFQCARLATADPNAGNGLELNAIAAVVIGGTRLRGGRGSVVMTLLGVLIMTVLQTGLASLGAREATKRIITGSVIILAVLANEHRRRLAPRLPQ